MPCGRNEGPPRPSDGSGPFRRPPREGEALSGSSRFRAVLGTALCAALLASAPVPASTLLMDLESGRTLLAEDADVPEEASGLLPLLAAFTALETAREKGVSPNAAVPNPWDANGPGVSLADLVRIVLMNGSRPALDALPQALGESPESFDARMTDAARGAGMRSAEFSLACGAASPCRTSARDVTLLARSLITRHPQTRMWMSSTGIELPGVPEQETSNLFMKRSTAISGVFVSADASCAAVLAENPRRSGPRVRQLLVVALGAQGRGALRDRVSSLLLRGWRDFETLLIYEEGARVAELPVLMGAKRTVSALADRSVFATLSRERMFELGAGAFEYRVRYSSPIIAPVRSGDRLGEAVVLEDGREIASCGLLAAEDVPEGDLRTRFMDRLSAAFGASDEAAPPPASP